MCGMKGIADVIIKQKVILFPNQTLINDTSTHPSFCFFALQIHTETVRAVECCAANRSISNRFVNFLIPHDFTRLVIRASEN